MMTKSMGRAIEMTLAFAALMLYISRPAHAYIDAGTGSYFLQVAIGTLAGVAFSVKLFWEQIRRSILSHFGHHSSAKKPPVTRGR